MNTLIEELSAVCQKHGVVLVGTRSREKIYGEITIMPAQVSRCAWDVGALRPNVLEADNEISAIGVFIDDRGQLSFEPVEGKLHSPYEVGGTPGLRPNEVAAVLSEPVEVTVSFDMLMPAGATDFDKVWQALRGPDLAADVKVVRKNAEARFIADGENLNCPVCGGSGHIDDIKPSADAKRQARDLLADALRNAGAPTSAKLVREGAEQSRVATVAIDAITEVLRTRDRTAEALQLLRPAWAQGYTSDSQAAQASSSAMTQMWAALGVDNQTAAMQKLRELTQRPHVLWQTGEPGIPSSIVDRNGGVTLGLCKVCGQGEADLEDTCPGAKS